MINRILAAAAFLCVIGLSASGSLWVMDVMAQLNKADSIHIKTVPVVPQSPTAIPLEVCRWCDVA